MKRYYVISFESNDALHKSGEQLCNADNPLHIGQTASCEVRLPNLSQYEDAVYAVIEKRQDNDGWKLIRTSPFAEHEVRVNGTPITYVHFLNDGDHITFEGQRQELLFTIREDENYNASGVVAIPNNSVSRPLFVWISFLTLAFCIYGFYRLYDRPMTPKMIEEAKQSVFQISVDSIKLLAIRDHDTLIVSECRVGLPGPGTAFLTTDSLLVTARHCIEPWLNVNDTVRMDTLSPTIPTYIKMALQAVTHEMVGDEDLILEMVSYCSISKMSAGNAVLFSVKSTDFTMNKEHDLMVEYGDFSHQYFWRSISARPRRIDMMMGDIAFMHVNAKGTIQLASCREMQAICSKPDHPVVIMGRPSTTVNNQHAVSTDAQIKQALSFNENGYPDTVLFHNGDVIPGFSGGPVLAKQGFRWRAVGVVSVTDKHGGKHHYSVPVTEIDRLKKQ
jgi:hypothetical protein